MIEIKFEIIDNLDEYRNCDPQSEYIDRDKIARKIEGKEIIVAKDGDKYVGLLRIQYFWSTRPYLESAYVVEAERGNGLGTRMLKFLEDYLVSEQYAYLFSSSEDGDDKAINWHKKNGFNEMGRLTDLNLPHDDVTEIFFSKKISDIGKLRKYRV